MAVVVLGDVAHGLLQALDDDAVLLGVVPQRRVDGLLGQKRAVHLHRGQPVQGLHDGLVRDLKGLLHRLALHEHGRHRARGDGGTAAEGLELRVLNDIVLVDVELHAAARILDLADVLGVGEVLHHFVGVVHSHGGFSLSFGGEDAEGGDGWC